MNHKLLTAFIFIAFALQANAEILPSGKITNGILNRTILSNDNAKLEKECCSFDEDSTKTAELKRLSLLWMESMLHHDSARLNDLMAPEYRLQRWDGKIMAYRSTWLDNLFNHIKITHWEQSDLLAQVYGDVAIVTSHYSWAGTFFDKEFDSKGYLTDVWVWKNNRWMVITRTNGAFEGSKTLYPK
jgi:Domain of unknown function (DUF4440)